MPVNSVFVPSLRLNHRAHSARAVDLFPLEKPGENIGFGTLPLLEVTRRDHALPQRDELEEELCSLLGPKMVFIRAVESPDLMEEALALQQWPARICEPKPTAWPEFQGPTAAPAPGGESRCSPVSVLSVGQCQSVNTVMRPGQNKYASGVNWRLWAGGEAPVVEASLRAQFDKLVSASMAENSWRSLRSVLKSVDTLATEFSLELSLPWTQDKLLAFVLAGSMKGWQSSTLRSYVSRVSSVQQLGGMGPVTMSLWGRKVLKGLENTEKKIPSRLAVTPAWLRLIRKELVTRSWPRSKKRLFWMACVGLFHGSLRSAEMLPNSARSWAPDSTLLGRDVKLKSEVVNGETVRFLILVVRNPKETARAAKKVTFVELYEQKGAASWFCPVRAYLKFVEAVLGGVAPPPGLPLMRRQNGRGYTAVAFNADLRDILTPWLAYGSEGGISAHSFRAGIASTLARLGFSEETIAAQGRWSSSCYLKYIKLGRATKLSVQRSVAEALAGAAEEDRSTILVV